MALFEQLCIRGVRLRNRIVLSPMCMYSCPDRDGMANDWHLVHLGARATGGAALVFTEATAVEPRGRISVVDLGLWEDRQTEPLARVVRFITERGSVAGIQLAHAGRKAGIVLPMVDQRPGDRWETVAPSPIPFGNYPPPVPLDEAGIRSVITAFAAAARRAVTAGFTVIEVHAAHGYLLHEFLSPLSNHREDAYGGSFQGRIRFLLEVVDAVRAAIPEDLALFVRISATGWAEGGWDLEQSVELARALGRHGADVIDASSGGLVTGVTVPEGPGYQVPFAERIRRATGISTMAVGLITEANQAETIVRTGQADLVALGRAMLRDPNWPLRSARELRADLQPPRQYGRAWQP